MSKAPARAFTHRRIFMDMRLLQIQLLPPKCFEEFGSPRFEVFGIVGKDVCLHSHLAQTSVIHHARLTKSPKLHLHARVC